MAVFIGYDRKQDTMGFFKAFNSLQITGLFAGFPFLISWLWTATFAGAAVAAWVALIVYLVFFLLMCGAVFHAFDD